LQNNEIKSPSDPEPLGEADNRTIYIRAIIDVAGVLGDRPDPLKVSKTATTIGFERGQMTVTTTAGTADRSTGDIACSAEAGDTVRLFAKSGSNNFEHAVLIAAIRHAEGDEVLKDSAPVNQPRASIVPASQAGGQPTKPPVEHEFWFWQCAVACEGIQSLSLILALYDRDEDGQPRFAGLYRWDLQLTVSSSPLSPDANTPTQEEIS
jgi:hypothetical protein